VFGRDLSGANGHHRGVEAPPFDSVERWAWDYIRSTSLEAKLEPPPAPDRWETRPPVRRLTVPGRPPELRTVTKAPRSRGLVSDMGRARALHTFFHHELQAAELMAWALLAFPDAPAELRAGLLRIAVDEVRHMRLYAGQIERLGHRIGEFTVRDWFWDRVPSCADPVAFVSTMGLGLESANLDHAAVFAARFRAVGDEEGARVQEVVGADEVGHVRFGATWFVELAGSLTFEAWMASLPAPLSPMLMRGRPLHREARLRAGVPVAFVDQLEAWQPA